MKFAIFFLTMAFLAPGVYAQLPEAKTTPAPRASMNAGEPTGGGGTGAMGLGDLAKDRPKDAKTEITAEKEATFDNVAGIATFIGKVVVKDPSLNMTCDKLVVTLNKNRKGMEKVEASGNVVIVHEGKDGDKPVKSIGRSQIAIYDPVKGDLILLKWPQIQQGINNHISTEEGTKMILNRNGRLNTVGGNRTQISDTTQFNQQPQ